MKKSDMDANCRVNREIRRVLRFLSRVDQVTIRPAATRSMMLLEGGERGTISASQDALALLARRKIVQGSGTHLSLTRDGTALVARMNATREPFLEQHAELGRITVLVDGESHDVEANLSESPLAKLARLRQRDGTRFLEENEVRAGERLRQDFTKGRIMPRLGINWSLPVASGTHGSSENGIADLTDDALAARQRVNRALDAVGPELAGVLVDVCCFLKGLERIEKEHSWPVRSAKIVLKTALAALSRHYEPKTTARRRRILHWGADGFRPRIQR